MQARFHDGRREHALASCLELLFLVAFAAFTTLLALFARPYWDDGFLALFHSTSPLPVDRLGDRVLYGAILLWTQQHLAAALAIHFFGWLGFGLTARALWNALFPRRLEFGLLAGLLAIAPVISKFQFALVNGAFYLIQVNAIALAIGGILWSFKSHGSRLSRYLVVGASFALIFGSGLISEYSVPATIAACVVVWLLLLRRRIGLYARVVAIGSILVCTLVSYAVFWWQADSRVRPDVRPEQLLGSSGMMARLADQGVNLVNDVSQLTAGRAFAAIGEFSVHADKRSLSFFLAGLATALIVIFVSRLHRQAEPSDVVAWQEAGTLIVAMVGGLLPIIAMNRVGSGLDVDTRFWLPVLPIAACLTTFVFVNLFRRRFACLSVLALSFVCGSSLVRAGYEEYTSARLGKKWGSYLHKRVTPQGLNVFYLDYEPSNKTKCLAIESAYELTARITEGWPQSERNRCWAWAPPTKIALSDPPPDLNIDVRGVIRQGKVEKFFLVEVNPEGQVARVFGRKPSDAGWVAEAL